MRLLESLYANAAIKKPQLSGLVRMAPRPGLEPGTNRLTVYCSTN